MKCFFIVLFFIATMKPKTSAQTSDSLSHISLGTSHAGIGFGPLVNYSGIRFNLNDKWDEHINGLSFSVLNTLDFERSPQSIMNGLAANLIYTRLGEVNGIAAGLLGELSDTTNGLSFGFYSSGGKVRNGITAGGGYVFTNGMNGIAVGLVQTLCDTGNGIQFAMGLGSTGNRIAHLANGLAIGIVTLDIVQVNGISLSVFSNQVAQMSGIAIAAVTQSANTNGFIGGVLNIQKDSSMLGGVTGLAIGLVNTFQKMTGVQIAAINRAKELHGIQFGLLNRADNAYFKWFPFVNLVLN